MPSRDEFRRKCHDNEDPFPRLVYADWLDDQGEPMGALIRVWFELRENWEVGILWREFTRLIPLCDHQALHYWLGPLSREFALMTAMCVLPNFEKFRPECPQADRLIHAGWFHVLGEFDREQLRVFRGQLQAVTVCGDGNHGPECNATRAAKMSIVCSAKRWPPSAAKFAMSWAAESIENHHPTDYNTWIRIREQAPTVWRQPIHPGSN